MKPNTITCKFCSRPFEGQAQAVQCGAPACLSALRHEQYVRYYGEHKKRIAAERSRKKREESAAARKRRLAKLREYWARYRAKRAERTKKQLRAIS